MGKHQINLTFCRLHVTSLLLCCRPHQRFFISKACACNGACCIEWRWKNLSTFYAYKNLSATTIIRSSFKWAHPQYFSGTSYQEFLSLKILLEFTHHFQNLYPRSMVYLQFNLVFENHKKIFEFTYFMN